jgi:hypothetical protein
MVDDMRLKIIRHYWHQKTADPKAANLHIDAEADKELLDVYRSNTGDYGDMPDQKEFDEWINDLLEYAIEGENLVYEE